MQMKSAVTALLAAVAFAPMAASAQPANSMPQPIAIPDDVPTPRDMPFSGSIRLDVDVTDVARGIFRIREVIPVQGPGPVTLLYPKWLPGRHSPVGPIDDIVGFKFSAGGKSIPWTRDPANVYALHLDVPADAREIVAEFQYVSPTSGSQGRITVTPAIVDLQWNLVSLYPAGWFVRRIPVDATVRFPAGWKYGTALETATLSPDNTARFRQINFEDLIDSPIFAGLHFRQDQLTPDVRMNIVADTPDELAANDEQLAKHRALIAQTLKLFGTQHYDHYDFLLAISDKLGGIGLEHHRSTEIKVQPGYFTKWNDNASSRNVVPHEFVHSWNGKYRRGADLFTPDYATPMRNSLLWVYEGQTQYWGYVLQARSGLVSLQDTLDGYAIIAAQLDTRPGRQWRPLIDTTNDPILAKRTPQPWVSWQRSEDYYNEGLLIWLDADMLIREQSGGKRSLDDFARDFFGKRDRDWGISTYTFKDVVAALNQVQPYDWAEFLHARVDRIAPRAPLDWLKRGGYRLVYATTPTPYWKARETLLKFTDFSYSLGFTLDKGNSLSQVMWDSPAFNAGLTVGSVLLAVNGQEYDSDVLAAAITAAAKSRKPISLLVKQGDRYFTADIAYFDGLKYPRLEKIGSGKARLDALLKPL